MHGNVPLSPPFSVRSKEGCGLENAKRGFVFYFDNYFVVEDLPPDQRGWLLSALCVYAERVDHYPQMSGQTRIACGFLGAAVLRDTQRWLSQRQARALRRQQGDRPGRPPAPARERSWSREQDMELTRKLAARLREEAAMAEAGGAEGQD